MRASRRPVFLRRTSASSSPTELFEIFRDYYGPTMNAFEAAVKDGTSVGLEKELKALFTAQNLGGASTEIPATFLKVTVNKP